MLGKDVIRDNNTSGSFNKIRTVDIGSLDLTLAKECIICGDPFAIDTDRDTRQICPECISTLKEIINERRKNKS